VASWSWLGTLPDDDGDAWLEIMTGRAADPGRGSCDRGRVEGGLKGRSDYFLRELLIRAEMPPQPSIQGWGHQDWLEG
jgi:hypothetical protein